MTILNQNAQNTQRAKQNSKNTSKNTPIDDEIRFRYDYDETDISTFINGAVSGVALLGNKVLSSSDNVRDTSNPHFEQNLSKRYKLQNAHKNIIRHFRPNNETYKSTCVCGVVSLGHIEIYRSDTGASYGGLVSCGLNVCPRCAERKSIIRRAYVALTSKRAFDDGRVAIMLNFTQRHKHGDTLKYSLDVHRRAKNKLYTTAVWHNFIAPILGENWHRVLETTYGFKNSWHPHTHQLFYVDTANARRVILETVATLRARRDKKRALLVTTRPCRRDDISRQLHQLTGEISELFYILCEFKNATARDEMPTFTAFLLNLWHDCLKSVGGDCDFHGVKTVVGDRALSEYLAKFGHDENGNWSIESELTMGIKKHGNGENLTPLQMLAMSTDETIDDTTRQQFRALWYEYCEGMSGAHVFKTSKNFAYGTPDETDDDDGNMSDDAPDGVLLATLTPTAWRFARRLGGYVNLLATAYNAPDMLGHALKRAIENGVSDYVGKLSNAPDGEYTAVAVSLHDETQRPTAHFAINNGVVFVDIIENFATVSDGDTLQLKENNTPDDGATDNDIQLPLLL